MTPMGTEGIAGAIRGNSRRTGHDGLHCGFDLGGFSGHVSSLSQSNDSALRLRGHPKHMRMLKRILAGVALIGVFWIVVHALVISPAKAREEQRTRTELFALDAIRGRIQYQLDLGGQLPTNWAGLSNSLISEGGVGFPLPMDKYTVLSKAIPYQNQSYRGAVFLVRSEPEKRSPSGWGRWALLAGQSRGADPGSKTLTNLLRTWIKEDELPPEIRSQVGSRARK